MLIIKDESMITTKVACAMKKANILSLSLSLSVCVCVRILVMKR